MDTTVTWTVIVIELVLGLILLFRGNKSVRLVLAILGLIGGATLGQYIVEFAQLTGNWELILPIVLAVLGALLLSSLISSAFFIGGAVVGWKLGEYLIGIFGLEFEPVLQFLILLAVSIVFGILMSRWQDEFIMLATSFLGAVFTVDALVGGYYLIAENQNVEIFSSFFETGQELIILVVVILISLFGYNHQKKNS